MRKKINTFYAYPTPIRIHTSPKGMYQEEQTYFDSRYTMMILIDVYIDTPNFKVCSQRDIILFYIKGNTKFAFSKIRNYSKSTF